MQLRINRELFYEPYFWAIFVPALLGFWAIGAAFTLNSAQDKANRRVKDARETDENGRDIMQYLTRSGKLGLDGGIGKAFEGIKSARECASVARIPETRLARLESSKIKSLKSGKELHRETYKLSNVKLLQIALFIDHAEQTYLNVSCHDLSMVFVKGKGKDLWDATVYLAYLENDMS